MNEDVKSPLLCGNKDSSRCFRGVYPGSEALPDGGLLLSLGASAISGTMEVSLGFFVKERKLPQEGNL